MHDATVSSVPSSLSGHKTIFYGNYVTIFRLNIQNTKIHKFTKLRLGNVRSHAVYAVCTYKMYTLLLILRHHILFDGIWVKITEWRKKIICFSFHTNPSMEKPFSALKCLLYILWREEFFFLFILCIVLVRRTFHFLSPISVWVCASVCVCVCVWVISHAFHHTEKHHFLFHSVIIFITYV